MSENVDMFGDARDYILGIPKFTGKNNIEDTKAFYQYLGAPLQNSRVIHVAGTNGKGSVCAYLDSILRQAGYQVGLFTSPHLISMCERIRLDGTDISEEEFVDTYQHLRGCIHQYQKEKGNQYHPSFFEFLFFMACLWYQKMKPEFVVMETGLGGRLDATNVVDQKSVCVITKISLDHTEFLGNTLEQIAREKAGIFRKNVPAVALCYGGVQQKTLAEEANKVGTSMNFVEKGSISFSKKQDKSIDFSIFSRYYGYINARLHTIACYQCENASLAVSVIETLPERTHITKEQIVSGLEKTKWAGRMEEIMPDVYVDGAHNEDGIQAFVETVRTEWENEKDKNHLMFGVVCDKDYQKMVKILAESGCFHDYMVTVIRGKREVSISHMRGLFEQYTNQKIAYCESMEQAFDQCLAWKQNGERLFIAGSLYLVGAVKEYIQIGAGEND